MQHCVWCYNGIAGEKRIILPRKEMHRDRISGHALLVLEYEIRYVRRDSLGAAIGNIGRYWKRTFSFECLTNNTDSTSPNQ